VTFEQRVARLEAIAEELERENIDLAHALELFDEGIEHLRAAAGDLANAEARVQRLIERADGTFDVADTRD
jgi:exodeoxyribonuclease VII small subunit